MTLDELSERVAAELAGRGMLGAAPDARVSAAPDARTVRYYATLGLLDRPRIEGRQARYGERHLLQLLAIKALQAVELPLAEIQQRLYARSDAELKALVEAWGVEAREEGAARKPQAAGAGRGAEAPGEGLGAAPARGGAGTRSASDRRRRLAAARRRGARGEDPR